MYSDSEQCDNDRAPAIKPTHVKIKRFGHGCLDSLLCRNCAEIFVALRAFIYSEKGRNNYTVISLCTWFLLLHTVSFVVIFCWNGTYHHRRRNRGWGRGLGEGSRP